MNRKIISVDLSLFKMNMIEDTLYDTSYADDLYFMPADSLNDELPVAMVLTKK